MGKLFAPLRVWLTNRAGFFGEQHPVRACHFLGAVDLQKRGFDFSAVWRTDNENPALANFLNLLRERYPLPSEA